VVGSSSKVSSHCPRSLRSFRITEVVALASEPVSLDTIATATGIPKPTVHRFMKAFVESGVLLREPHGKAYSIGERLWAMASGAMGHSSLRNERRSILRTLVDQIGETCNFTTLDVHDVVYVDRVEASWPLQMHLLPGSRVPIHCTSSGKLFLANMPARKRRRLLYGASLKRFTGKTITDPARLEAELRRIRKTKISTDDEGYLAGLISVAVPVRGRNRRLIGAVAVHAPTARLSLKRAIAHVGLLRRAASDLGRIYRQFR
jgi:IclR family transcriptional regulator, acetate operon repressor